MSGEKISGKVQSNYYDAKFAGRKKKMPVILPYRTEYVSTEHPCAKCRQSIARDSVQIGIMQQVIR